LAVAEMLATRRHQVQLLVSEKAVDQAVLSAWTTSSAASGITVQPLGAVGFTGWRGWTHFCVRFVRAWADCRAVCNRFAPDAVLGMGGFTSAPAVLAAGRRVARVIHESNAVPGKANRWSGRLADHVAVGLRECARFFDHKPVTVTGTPLRPALRVGRQAGAHARLGLDPARLTLLVMGGSQGARAINDAVATALPRLADWRDRIQFIHLAGPRDDAAMRALYEQNWMKANVLSFCSEMQWPYSAADLVISRAGAGTLTELAAFGLPALLMPYPQAAGNHQWHNARVFETAGAARLLGPNDNFTEALLALLADAPARTAMAECARSLAVNDAAERIADLVETYAN
jgi:UDP-N-acetylglucosamine--N-acetylmuramyl-(pentapeptide) pyrophosphoryl-undecaprenol N-acetylglucosamine transferase